MLGWMSIVLYKVGIYESYEGWCYREMCDWVVVKLCVI